MAGDRIFTDKDLEEFSKHFMGLAMEAVERGDLEKAKYRSRRQDATKDVLHDLYLHWTTGLLSYIYDNWGEDAAVRAVRDTATQGQSGFALRMMKSKGQIMAARGIKGYLKALIDIFRQHSGYPGLTVQEDDEKIILTAKQCGSGGRLIDMGAYEGPFAYRKLKKAGPHTWGEEDLPIYCSHCAWVHEIAPLFTKARELSFGSTQRLSQKSQATRVFFTSTKIPRRSRTNTMRGSE